MTPSWRPPVRLTAAGGVEIDGGAEISLLVGDAMMAARITIQAGYHHPWHVHPDHESIGVLLRGRLRMRIADDWFEFGPGDGWTHPKGVFHETLALDDCEVLEFHTPLRPDLLDLLDKEHEQ